MPADLLFEPCPKEWTKTLLVVSSKGPDILSVAKKKTPEPKKKK
jgi:hypothetical protein